MYFCQTVICSTPAVTHVGSLARSDSKRLDQWEFKCKPNIFISQKVIYIRERFTNWLKLSRNHPKFLTYVGYHIVGASTSEIKEASVAISSARYLDG